MVRLVQEPRPPLGATPGENMWTNQQLETRIVILEAALDWVRYEATTRTTDPHAMARIAAIAMQVLEDDEITMTRRLANARDRSGVELIELMDVAESDASPASAIVRAG